MKQPGPKKVRELPVLRPTHDSSYPPLNATATGSPVQRLKRPMKRKASSVCQNDQGQQEADIGTNWMTRMFSRSSHEREERLFGPVDLRIVKRQIEIWSSHCSFCYIRGYWCSKNHKIADCRASGADKVRQTREALQREMVTFRERGGTFCSRQCEHILNFGVIEPDRALDPECACEAAVLDTLSAMTTDGNYDFTGGDVKTLMERALRGEEKDLNAWLCSTEEYH
jgi:hypothetical protein